jgi:hypothetical protein
VRVSKLSCICLLMGTMAGTLNADIIYQHLHMPHGMNLAYHVRKCPCNCSYSCCVLENRSYQQDLLRLLGESLVCHCILQACISSHSKVDILKALTSGCQRIISHCCFHDRSKTAHCWPTETPWGMHATLLVSACSSAAPTVCLSWSRTMR